MVFENFTIPDEEKPTLECFYKEIVEDGEYDRFDIKVEPGDIVVDCGANIGLFSRYATDIMGASKVYSFELSEFWYEYLVQNTACEPKITTQLANISPEEWSLSHIMDTFNIKYIDFLKMDIEGAEFGYITSTPDHVLAKVKKIAMEIHMGSSNNGKWLLLMLEKLSKNKFDIKLEWIHKDYNIAMVYAKRPFLHIT